MLWVDKAVSEIRERFAAHDDPLVVRDEKTLSGRVHIGSMRGVAIHGTVADALTQKGVSAEFHYELNDFDPMDGMPSYLDADVYGQYMGKSLNTIPSPEAGADNFAAYYAQEFCDVIETAGFHPTFYRASELYLTGRMDEAIRTALDAAADIRRIYKTVSGSKHTDDWYPLSVACEQCGRIGTTRVTSWDGERVTYRCEANIVAWAQGCGHEGAVSPFGGNAKLPWKVEWPAKWKVLGVHVEGAGKDHSTKGGARDVANHIARDIFGYEPPYDIPYEFFLVGGKKMSSSKGQGATAAEVAALIPAKLLRLVLVGTKPARAINLDPAGDTIPTWFDWYDTIAQKYWDGVGDDDARLFELVHTGTPPAQHYLPRFSTVAFLVQMKHLSVEEEVAKLKEAPLTEAERAELAERAEYARGWLARYAPERYRFEIQQSVPEAARALTSAQKDALARVAAYVEEHGNADGQVLHTALHDMRKELDIDAKSFFGALYLSILGTSSGPKAGWFLSVLEQPFLVERLRAVAT